MARQARRLNPAERMAELSEQLLEERHLREEAEDEAFALRGRLARIEGLASVEDDDEDEDEKDDDEEEDDDEE